MAYNIAFDIFAKDRASATFDKLGRKVGETEGKFSKHAAAIGAGLATAGVALVGFAKTSIDAYTDAEKSQRVLTDAYQRFPALADVPLQSLRDQAQALQSVTKFDGDATAAAMGQLAAYKLTGAQVQQLTPLLLDYAEKTGKDLPTAAGDLGKALLGQGRALKGIGLNFKDTGSTAGNFAELMGGLRTQVGGFAQTEGASAEGRAAILKNKFDDLKEAVGARLLPALLTLANAGIKVLDFLQQNSAAATAAKVALVVLGAAVVVATGAWVAMNLAFIATPVGALITGLVLLAGALVVAYKRSQTFRDFVSVAFNVVKIAVIGMALQAAIAFQGLLKVALFAMGAIIHNAAVIFGWLPFGIGQKLKDADAKFTSFKNSANNTMSKVRTKLEISLSTSAAELAASRLAAKMHQLQSKSIYIAVHYTTTAARIWDGTKFVNVGLRAGGGPIRKGHPYIVGEQGPELIYPTADGMVVNAKDTAAARAGGAGGTATATAGGGDQNVTVQFILDGRVIQQSLLRLKRTGGVELGLT